jgi:enamine deaminase RidA (YjgF/YER057c/UK114 family)
MKKIFPLVVGIGLFTGFGALAQSLEMKRISPSEWTKGRFTEMITTKGQGKTIYLAGVGAEDEDSKAGAPVSIRHPNDPYAQCKYSYDKIKRLLAAQGATLDNIVKRVLYVTDARYRPAVAKCTAEVFGDNPQPVSTGLIVNGLAFPEMLVEIDITAAVPD